MVWTRIADVDSHELLSADANTEMPRIPDSRALLSAAIERLRLSARAYHRVLKVARTCADLAGAPRIRIIDAAEAVRLRALDRV